MLTNRFTAWLFKRRVVKSLQEKIWLDEIDIAYNKVGLRVCTDLLGQQKADLMLVDPKDEKSAGLKQNIEANIASLNNTKTQLEGILDTFTARCDQLRQKLSYIKQKV